MKTKNVSRLLVLATAVALTSPMAYAQTATTSGVANTSASTTGTSVNGTANATTATGVNYNESSSSTMNGTLNSGNMNASGVINGNGSAQTSDMNTDTPGVPNTGAGGESTMNFLVLFFSGIGMMTSVMLLRRKFTR